MENAIQNPLVKYFRQPSIYLKLPSNGQFWKEGAVNLPVTGEIPVYPMTAKDEVTLRTPDALMNGAGVVEVIHSCCPNITDAWSMPSVDVDAVLIGIRIASYGAEMPVDTNCPKCDTENTHEIDLSVSLASITCPDYTKTISLPDGLQVKCAPQAYFSVNRKNTISFEEQRLMQALEKTDDDSEARMTAIANSMTRLIQISIDTVTDSTEYIEMADGTRVTEKEFIREFYSNANGSIVRTVQEQLANINTQGSVKEQSAACSNCKTEYKIPILFDYANFFAIGS